MTDELITPITQMHVHGIDFEKKEGYCYDNVKEFSGSFIYPQR